MKVTKSNFTVEASTTPIYSGLFMNTGSSTGKIGCRISDYLKDKQTWGSSDVVPRGQIGTDRSSGNEYSQFVALSVQQNPSGRHGEILQMG